MKRITLWCALVLSVTASPVYAQSSTNPVLAEQLFSEGRELAKKNDWAGACPKFEASLRYDPTLGTKLNLATCYEKIGKLASAWSLYLESAELASSSNDTKRRDYARQRAAELKPRLAQIAIMPPPTMPTGFTVTQDGTPIDAGTLGTGIYVDPGEHTIVASAPGFESFTVKATAIEQQTKSVPLPELKPGKTEPTPTTPTPVAPTEESKEPAAMPQEAPSHTRAYVGIGTAVAGALVLGGGLVFGSKARTNYNDAKKVCPDLACASPADYQHGQDLISDARLDGNISTAMVAVGGVAIAGGIVLWLTAPTAKPTETAHLAPSVTSHSAALVFGGSF